MIEQLTYLCDKDRHLICYPFTVENLHKMAADLGIDRCWFHTGSKPHYDIPKKRIAVVAAKCNIVTPREIFKIIAQWQQTNTNSSVL